MIIGVDGTGDEYSTIDKKHYDLVNRHSFVNQVIRACHKEAHRTYIGGPSIFGMECDKIVSKVLSFIRHHLSGHPDEKVFMTGWSRGGAICIEAAYQLQGPVAGLFLFDPVARQLEFKHVDQISDNVAHAYLARRDPKADSRPSFGNCGLSARRPGVLESRLFYATHAALGGEPWTGDKPPLIDRYHAPARDAKGSAEVKQWMWAKLRFQGLIT